MLWEKSRDRIRLEQELMQQAVREGMADVYVALKRLKRSGPQRRLRPKADPVALHSQLMAMARQFPDNVRVVSP